MASKTYTLTGECKWAKVWKPDQKYGKHSIDLKLDSKAMKTFMEMGLQNKPKEDEDGNLWVSLRRDPLAKVFVRGSEDKTEAGRPMVTGVDNEVEIGNGSTVTVKVTVYDYDNKFGKGKGSRLDSVHVDKLVEFKRAEATSDEVKSPFDAS